MQTSEAASEAPTDSAGRIVLRNTMYLGLAEVLIIPLSILLNGLMGRYLGPEDMGHLYLSMTLAKFAFLVVEWGHGGALPAAVVLDRNNAGKLLGTSLAWRGAAAIVTYATVAIAGHALGYNAQQQWVIALTFLFFALGTFVGACQEVVRGFERTDIAAYSRVGSQVLMMVFVASALVLGGRLRLAIAAQALATFCVLVAVVRALGGVGVGKIGWQRSLFKSLMKEGTPFVFFSAGLVVQPAIDAFYLAKLCPTDVVGWFSVAQKLVGFLILPAMVLVSALYPTLCRLYAGDANGFRQTTRDSVGAVSMLIAPAALGCALFPDLGVRIYGRETFYPAENTLRVFSVFLTLIYFTLPVGTAILAAGRKRAWTIVQFFSVGSSVVFDPILIRYFQEQHGNGGMGLAIASTIAESIMAIGGIWLLPARIFDRALGKTLGLAALSGIGMAATAFALRSLPSLLVAPIALLVYGGGLVVSGAITPEQRASITGFVSRKLGRARSKS